MKNNEQLIAILFSDLKGYSKVKDNILLSEISEINNQIKKEILTVSNHIYCNTWGDAFFICSYRCSDIAEIALKILDKIKDIEWKKLGFVEELAIRIGLHVQNAVIQTNDENKVINIIGSEISRAARIEPIVEENQIYCSKVFFEVLSDEKNYKYKFTPLGNRKLAKEFGEMELFQLDWFNLKTFLHFHESDLDIAENIVKGLIEKGIHVYNDNPELFKRINKLDRYNTSFNNNISDQDVPYLIILFTSNYLKKYGSTQNSDILDQSISNEGSIFLIKIGGGIGGKTKFEPIIGEITIEDSNKYLIAIDAFVEKVIPAEEINASKIKPYRSIETVLNLFRPHLSFKRIGEFLSKSEKIGYELYLAFDLQIKSTSHYFLYLYAGCGTNKTFNYISKRHPEIIKGQNLTIFFPKEKKQKKLDIRKNNIFNLFKPSEIHYIDEFIWDFCTADEFKKPYDRFNVKNYVDPYFSERQDIKALEHLQRWYFTENNPILAIKGSGGIGKTTLVKYFSDLLASNDNKFRSLFIDTSEIITKLKQFPDRDNLGLYDFYSATSQRTVLEEEAFRLNIDNGNVLLIIDGLDEVLSKIDGFNLDNFLKSIHDYSNEIGNGKVLITCRNYFWNRSNPAHEFESIELLPFDVNLANQFLQKNFHDNENLVKKGLRIANNLTRGGKEYIPYVLDIISYILKGKSDEQEFDDPTFISDLMNIQIMNDYILYKFCAREGLKLGTPDVDSQIKFFIKIASEYHSIIKQDRIKELTKETFIREIDENQIKDHPILLFKDGILTFKYDFFEEHFKNIQLGLLFKQKINVDLSIIEILNTYVRFNSSFIDDCCIRLGPLDDERKIILLRILDETIKFEEGSLKNEAISAIFQIALKALQKQSSLIIEKTTELMKELFYAGDMVKNLAIVKMNEINSPKLIFDFSNLKFIDCYFSEYDYFWECRFNEGTYFDSCKFNSLDIKHNVNTTATANSFNLRTCIIDDSVERVLHKKAEYTEDIKRKRINELRAFLKLFYKNGTMVAERENIMRSKYKGPFDKLFNLLIDKDFIKEYKSEKKALGRQWHIADSKKQDAIKFCLEGTVTPEINKVLNSVLKLL